MKRHPGFVQNWREEANNYREDHRGIPIKILLFMAITRSVLYVVTVIPILVAAFFISPYLQFVLWLSFSFIYGLGAHTRLDPWTIWGFRVFKWMIAKK